MTTVVETKKRVRGADTLTFEMGEAYLERRMRQLNKDELIAGHAELFKEEAARFQAIADGLLEVAQHIIDGTKPAPVELTLPDDPIALKRIIAELQAKQQQPAPPTIGFIDRNGKVWKSKPGRKPVAK